MSQNARAERARKVAEERAAQERREKMRRNLNIGAVVVVVLLIVGGAFVVTRMTGSSTVAADQAPAAGASDYGVAIGSADAPHSVVIYEDFLCPYCGAFEAASSADLSQLADQGKVYVDYRPFQFFTDADYSGQAVNAFAVVLDAAGPEVAKTFHDELYADQPSEQGPFPDADWLVEKAVTAGADEAAVRPGIEDMAQQAWVDGGIQQAADIGIDGTPTILLDGKPFTEGSTIDGVAQSLVAAVS